MTRERKQPAILKPLIDEEMTLRFAAPPAQVSSPAANVTAFGGNKVGKGRKGDDPDRSMQVTVMLPSETYGRIVREAARKERTVEELLRRHLIKHYGKD